MKPAVPWRGLGWLLMGMLAWSSAGMTATGVDLVVSEIVPSAVAPSKILVIVRNRGTEAMTRNIMVELRLDEAPIGRQEISDTLKPNAGPTYVEFKRPERIDAGLHMLSATVDADASIEELSEDNNTKGMSIWVKE